MNMMKLVMLAAVLFGFVAQARADVQADLRRLENMNGICRGGSGDNPETIKACTERDRLVTVVEKQGWCWGPKEAAEYQKKWQPCRSEFDKSNWLPLRSERGVAYYLDLDAVRTREGLRARIVAEGAGVPPPMRNVVFTLDCKGRFRNEVLAEQYRVWESVKPDSLIATAEGPVCYSGK